MDEEEKKEEGKKRRRQLALISHLRGIGVRVQQLFSMVAGARGVARPRRPQSRRRLHLEQLQARVGATDVAGQVGHRVF